MLDLEDAEGLAVPLAMFPSEGEPADLACSSTINPSDNTANPFE